MRIVRELVVYAIRHGHAHSIKIAGSRTGGRLLFSVRDDGEGFDAATAPGIAVHLALTHSGIREHVSAIYAKLSAANRAEAVAIALKKHLLDP